MSEVPPESDGLHGDARIEPRLSPGNLVAARCLEPADLNVRLLRTISRDGCSIITDTQPPAGMTVHFEFATSCHLLITTPARLVYARAIDLDGKWHVSGWRFAPDEDVREAVATVVEYLIANLAID